MKHKPDDNQDLPAGDFSAWLRQTLQAQVSKNLGAAVPCGECTACCRSSLFIHIKPDETDTLRRIPKELLFPAPGLPAGNLLMGYDENGRCPMFQDNKCSIYDSRPQTCREFDCRIFSATGVEMDDSAQVAIVERARRWRFSYPNETDRAERSAINASVKFLQEHPELFPARFIPRNPTQFALLAIKIYRVFQNSDGPRGAQEDPLSDSEIAKRILEAVGSLGR